MINEHLLEILCCPKCNNDLVYDKVNQKLICEICILKFCIRECIPVMLIDEAEGWDTSA